MKVNVIGMSNGVGLSRDLLLMAEALRHCGCDVNITDVDSLQGQRRRSRRMQFGMQLQRAMRRFCISRSAIRYDINVMMEHVWTQFLETAHCNIAVPNPEWFDRHDMRFRTDVDCIWAKTRSTQDIFASLGSQVSQIGFDSEDRYDPDVPRERLFLHLAGKSTMKGTRRLLDLWCRHPEWPTLMLVQHESVAGKLSGMTANVEVHTEYLDDRTLKRLQNRCLFHVCTSETEGWGHYLAEAMSVGAIVITVDAPPMNELVTAERGMLVAYGDTGHQKLARLYLFDEAALTIAVQRAVEMGQMECARQSRAARGWFLKNKEEFSGRVMRALGELDV